MSNSSEEERPSTPSTKCLHKNGFYTGRSREDWWDGDEEDEFFCNDCKEYIWFYVPR